jgi:hypothetical protein
MGFRGQCAGQQSSAAHVFERTQTREKELNDAMKQEHARREAAVNNIALARDAK